MTFRCFRVVLLLLLWARVSAVAQVESVTLDFDRPPEGRFVVDEAELLDTAAERELQRACEQLLQNLGRPLVVVTIPSMSAHGGRDLSIEYFARFLFDQWGLGSAETPGGNRGILFLVSRDDRKARIELGADWPVAAERQSQRVMQQVVIPYFRHGDYSRGILQGTRALADLARNFPSGISDDASPQAPAFDPASYAPRQAAEQGPAVLQLVLLTLVGLVMLVGVVSLVRSGTRGVAWYVGTGLLAVIALTLYALVSEVAATQQKESGTGRNDDDDDDDDDTDGWRWLGGTGGSFGGSFGGGSSGGGFSGGSFGGGFSGGGGASGSW